VTGTRNGVTLAEAAHNATTIAIVLHGIGDHSATDIISAAEHVLASTPSNTLQTVRVEINDLPQPKGFKRHGQQALEIRAPENRYLVIPIVWSSFRARATEATQLRIALDTFHLIATALPSLILIIADAVRCIPQATRRWRLGIAAIVALVSLVTLSLIVGVFYLFVRMPAWLILAGAYKSGIFVGGAFLLFASFVVGWLFLRALPLLDLLGDIACYVGRNEVRQRLLDGVKQTVDACINAAPQAKILIIGHSLGSVVATHSLAQLPPDNAARRSTFLLTLGSPLCLMSRMFPAHILSPTALVEQFQSSRAVAFWANLWRDNDFIGRALKPLQRAKFAEISLGLGPHWNYWADERLWRRIAELLRAVDTGVLAEFDRTWEFDGARKARSLTQAEEIELANYIDKVRRLKWFPTIVGLFGFSVSSEYIFWAVPSAIESNWLLGGLRVAWITGFVSIIYGFYLASNLWNRRANNYEWLEECRFKTTAIELIGLAGVIVGGGLTLYLYYFLGMYK
jgi:hypothetical protein